jgi:hypothetical protein
MPASDLSNGELLNELRVLAMEARDRCSLYIREVRDDGGDIGNALTFLKQVGNALSPSRGDLYDLNSSIHCLKWVLDKAAASRPTPERDSARRFSRDTRRWRRRRSRRRLRRLCGGSWRQRGVRLSRST